MMLQRQVNPNLLDFFELAHYPLPIPRPSPFGPDGSPEAQVAMTYLAVLELIGQLPDGPLTDRLRQEVLRAFREQVTLTSTASPG
jgi:hypothetical protein